MKTNHGSNHPLFSIVARLILVLSMVVPQITAHPALAQGGNDIQRERNTSSGRVSFISFTGGQPLPFSRALGMSIRPQDPAMALASRYGPEFGLQDAERNLARMESSTSEDGRLTVRFQQNHEGVPVMGGELIVNTNDQGDLYSISGEVSPNISIATQPTIDAAQARESALLAMAKWYGNSPDDFLSTQPELWIYDESLLRPSTRPVELTWRMDVTPLDAGMPVRELVLINAQHGGITLHFNQIDSAWGAARRHIPNGAQDAAATLYVATTGNDGNSCTSTGSPCLTINGAMGKAAASGDTIKVAAGTYTGSAGEVVLVNKSVSLSGGWNAGFTTQNGMSTIDGQAVRRGISVDLGAIATIDHFVLQNGLSTPIYEGGGGVFNAGTLTLSHSTVTQSSATGYAGGGGGVFNQYSSTMTITESVISGNTATGSSSGGGGIYNNGTMTLDHTTISGNTSGGGIYNHGTMFVNNSAVTNNANSGDGGGISNTFGTLTVNNSTISKNMAYSGAGLYNGGTAAVNSSTISYNTATNIGGIFSNSSSGLSLQNTIVANNTGSIPDCNAFSITSGGYNIIGNAASCGFTPAAGDLFNVDPKLGRVVGNPAYIPLASNSPAVDAGNPTGCMGSSGLLPSDQRGIARVGRCDIGAYEYTVPGAASRLVVVNGSDQASPPLFDFPNSLQAVVLDSQGTPVPGVNVTFTAPSSGASGVFATTGTNTTSTLTDKFGLADSSTFTANDQSGSYTVSASSSGASSASFNLSNALWYVAVTGNDANSCTTIASPCATINGVIAKASNGGSIFAGAGTYTGTGSEVVLVDKTIRLYGGWNAGFTAQTGISSIDGQFVRRVMTINSNISVTLEKFIIQNGLLAGNSVSGILNYGSLLIRASTIRGNHSDSDAGAITNLGSLTLTDSSVIGNRGNGVGNGVLWSGIPANATIQNTTISSNNGNGILNAPTGTLSLNNVTVTRNISYNTAGIHNQGTGSIVLKNSIVTGNTRAGVAEDCYGQVTSHGYNIVGKKPNCTFTASTGDLFGVDPKLGELVGLPAYHPLMAVSPAIDAGSGCLATDQRGVSRPQGPACDRGAYEYTIPGPVSGLSVVSGDNQHAAPGYAFASPLQVAALDGQGSPVANVTVTFTTPGSGASAVFADTGTQTSSAVTNIHGIATSALLTANSQLGAYAVAASASGAESTHFDLTNMAWYVSLAGDDDNVCSSPQAPCQTIQAALAKATDGDTLLVAKGGYTGNSSGTAIPITKSVILLGGWDDMFIAQSGRSIIDGQNTVAAVSIMGQSVTLDHFIIQNGYGSYSAAGGGISNRGSLTVSNSIIRNNSAPNGGGGGIWSYGGSLTLIGSAVINNTASSSGGGIYVENGGTANIINSTISGNNGGTGNGGGIYLGWGDLTLQNASIVNNSAALGGGLYTNLVMHAVTIRNSILAKNIGGTSPDCSGTISNSDHNIIQDPTSYCDLVVSFLDQLNVDPQLGPFNTGLGYYPLTLGSPAIDAGNSSYCPEMDQLGIIRPQASGCDVGAVEYVFDQSADSLLINTYNGGNLATLPGTFVCDQTDVSCSNGDTHARAAHQYAIGTYNLYKSIHGRSSIDHAGMEINSTVHYRSGFSNAFWNGYMMLYGDKYGFPLADDIVAHELTHGVTQYESNLFYYYQSGAINESFSDLWGEYYDQTNGLGNDATSVKWIIGEGTSGYPIPAGFTVPAMRSMSNPPALKDPDKISSSYYYEGQADNGGVHWNSGVNNKAVYLMVDGGTFNTKTVTALGWEKTAAIYYEVNTNLLTSGADYSDLYYALQQACTNLVGQKGITAADCIEVKDAIDAVEMNSQPAANFNTNAPLCSTQSPVIAFSDDLETGTANWTFANGAHPRWQYDSPYGQYAQSGQHFLYADDYPQYDNQVTNASATLKPFVVPNYAYLWFAQAYEFEYDASGYYDGGVLEYSTNGGTTWVDAGSLMEVNKYTGKIYSTYINPLKGRSAFVGSSHGYISTRLNLSTLAQKTVTFRWRMGLDDLGTAWGWWLDNIKVYTCGPASSFADVPNTHPYYNDIQILYANGLTGGCGTSPLKFCPDQIMNRGAAAVFMLRANFGPSYVPPAPTHFFKDDWSKGTWAEPWAEGMKKEGLSAGCLASPPKYCPWDQIPREQAVIFALRMKYGKDYTPPAATGTVFADMTNPGYYATAWAEQAYKDELIKECGTSGGKPNFCPKDLVSRGLAAYMIVRAKDLTMP